MNPKHCVSLELSKKLKSCGYPQKEGEFWWINHCESLIGTGALTRKCDFYLVHSNWSDFNTEARKHFPKDMEVFVSPLASELMERLPDFIDDYQLVIRKLYNGTRVSYGESTKDEIEYFAEYTLSDTLAEMYIYLVVNKLPKETTK